MPAPETQQEDASVRHVLLPAFERLGGPVFLFGVVFFLATVAITLIVTPDRFPVRIGDHIVRLIDLEQEQKQLLIEKSDLESRHGTTDDARAPVLHLLSALKTRVLPIGTVLLAIDDARARFRTVVVDPISLPGVSVGKASNATQSGSVITITGEVRDLGGHTMQMLASFVDRLRDIPSVFSVSEPEYTEKTDVDSTSVSPFSITILLHDAR